MLHCVFGFFFTRIDHRSQCVKCNTKTNKQTKHTYAKQYLLRRDWTLEGSANINQWHLRSWWLRVICTECVQTQGNSVSANPERWQGCRSLQLALLEIPWAWKPDISMQYWTKTTSRTAVLPERYCHVYKRLCWGDLLAQIALSKRSAAI